MAATKDYLAFDLGAESGRAIVGRFDGQRLTLETIHRFANPTVQLLDTFHWNTPGQFAELVEGLRIAGDLGLKLAGIGVDTWGVDFGLFGADGSLLGLPVHYRDGRTDGMLDEAFSRLGKARIFERTGIQFMQLNTLYQLLAMKLSNAPQLGIAAKLLFTPDIFNYWLSGRMTSETSIASTSQFWDPVARGWCTDLLTDLGIPTSFLPDIVEPGTVLAPLLGHLAKSTGVGDVPVIAPAEHDTGSAVAAVPAEHEHYAYLSSGTWSLMGIESPRPLITDQTRELNFTNEAGVDGTIRFLKNIMGLWLVQQVRASLVRAGQDRDYAALTAEAAAAESFGAIVDPDHAAFLNPEDMPTAIREVCTASGQAAPDSIGALVRCCLESLALKYRWVVERLEEVRGAKIEVINIVGGGTQNKLLSQLTADCTGKLVICGPIEATATGNLLMQARATGELGSLAELRQVVRNSFEMEQFEPDASKRGPWDDAYLRFLGLL